MRCSHCSSGRMKRAENFGAERLQCGSCGVVTKQAHHSLTGKQQEFINYVGMWSMERIENAWEVTQDLDQNGIGMAIGISRSNVPRLVEPLITAGLVRKKKAHILDENNRVKSHKKWVYYLTPEGRKHVTESQRAESVEAETFASEIKFYGGTQPLSDMKMIWLHYSTDLNGDPTPHLTFDYYDSNHIPSNTINYWHGRPDGLRNRDGITIDNINELIQAHNDWVDETGGWGLEKLPYPWNGDYVISGAGRTEGWRNSLENFYEAETFESETFEASRSELRTRRRIPFYDLYGVYKDWEDVDVNKFARTNAGGALWQATYQALRDEGRSHAQAETFCNTKFFDQYYEYLIEGLRTPMRNLLNSLQKPSLGLTRKQRKSNREARRRFERYFPDKASENFQAHEGGHIDDSFEAPNRYPVRPTRPSEDWPRPTPRPRRPNRRPNPRPRPARRPF